MTFSCMYRIYFDHTHPPVPSLSPATPLSPLSAVPHLRELYFYNLRIVIGLLIGVAWVLEKMTPPPPSPRQTLTTNYKGIFRDGYMLMSSFPSMMGCWEAQSCTYLTQAITTAVCSRLQ